MARRLVASAIAAAGLLLLFAGGSQGAPAAVAAASAGPSEAGPPGGYWLVASDGGIFNFGDAGFFGSTVDVPLAAPIRALAPTPSGNGYWLVASDGGIFAFGDARFFGSTGALSLAQPIVGMATTPSGNGYWLVASDGGIFAFGDARFFGSTGALSLARPIVGMTPTPSGRGYWMVASDGGIFSFGDAVFLGSTGALSLAQPIVGMATTPSGNGYWLVASDGGIFAFGDARFFGSTGALALAQPVVDMQATATGLGYWLVSSDGGIFSFGDAVFLGSTGDLDLTAPIAAAATTGKKTTARAPKRTTSTTTSTSTTSTSTTSTTSTSTTSTSTTSTTAPPPPVPGIADVKATAETAPVPHSGDAADDPAIWVHPTDPALSVVVGTDKLGGLAVYDLSGAQLQYDAGGRPNNVDLRYGFPLGGQQVDLVVSTNRDDNTLRFHTLDPATRNLVAVGQASLNFGGSGLCLYQNRSAGTYYAFVQDSSGNVQQWRITEGTAGTVTASRVRMITLSSVAEGCVADDETGALYVAQEDVAIWRYGAEPGAGTTRTQVDAVGSGRLVADVEGLTIVYGAAGRGHLLASSQGNSTYVAYQRDTNAHAATFRVVDGTTVDGTSYTDGIDALAFGLGPAYPGGVFVAQDNDNPGSTQNFKLVPWPSVVQAAGLTSYGTVDPRTMTASGQTYYVDAAGGSDSNAGTSTTKAWKTTTKASAAPLAPGDRVLLRRGQSWADALTVSASGASGAPIAVGAYGTGAEPRLTSGSCLRLEGSWIVVEGLHLDACSWSGIRVSGSNNRITGNRVTNNVTGIYLRAGSSSNVVASNQIVDNNRMSVLTETPTSDDSGAFGILLHGDQSEIAYNTISGSDAFSYDYGRDGAAIEVYGGQGNHVHHNLAVDNDAFTELGNSRAADNTFAYNEVRSSLATSVFVVTRGASSSYGPVLRTRLYGNTAWLTGAQSQGVVCHAGCGSDILTMRNNVVHAVAKAAYADNPFDEGHNVYWGGPVQFTIAATSRIADPQLVDPASGDLRPTAASPVVDAGAATTYTADRAGNGVPTDGNADGVTKPDIGAYEYQL